MRKLNVAIVGCGRVAGHHARSILKLPEFNLVAVCDINQQRVAQLAKETGAHPYDNYHALIRSHPEIDVVSIITPSGMHPEHALDMIYYGKHVVIEKPPFMTISQGRELKAAAAHNGVGIFPVFQYRFNRSVQRIRRAVASNELGKLVLATVRTRWCRPQAYYDRDPWRGTFALDGGACTNQGVHHLDLLRYLAGDIRRVNATMGTYGANIEVEDTVVATVEFVSGAKGLIEVTTAARPKDFESSISFLGTSGLAMVGGWATNELTTFSPDPTQEDACSEEFPDVYGFGHTDIYRGVYSRVIKGDKPAVEFDDAMNTMRLLHAIYASDERGAWVNLKDEVESTRLGRANDKISALYRTPK